MLENDFLRAINAKGGTSGYTSNATVTRIEDGTAWVHIEGGVDETPASMAVSCSVGETVRVRVERGSAWITGNSSSPPTDDTTARKAQRTADSALTESERAKSAADDAQASADTAKAAADSATDYANAAMGEAESARESADLAKAQTAIAKSAADDAQENAGIAEDVARKSLSNLLTTEKAAELAQTASGELAEFLDDIEDDDAIIWKGEDGVHVTDSSGNSRAVYGADGVDYYDNSLTSVSHFGADGARIGKASNTHISIDEDSFDIYRSSRTIGSFAYESVPRGGHGMQFTEMLESLKITSNRYALYLVGPQVTIESGGDLYLNASDYIVRNPDKFRSAIEAAEESHTHSASEITSGVLPIEFGGTGADDAEIALDNLGGAPFNHSHSPASIGAAAEEHTHDKSEITAVVSWNETKTVNTHVYTAGGFLFIFYQGETKAHSANTTLFTLPSGYRPSATVYVPFTKNANAYGSVAISSSGTCIVNAISSTSANGRIYFTAVIPL